MKRSKLKTRISALFCSLLISLTAFSGIIAEAANLACREDLGEVGAGAGFGGAQTLMSLDIGEDYYGICVHPNSTAKTGNQYTANAFDEYWTNSVTDDMKEAAGLIGHYGYPNGSTSKPYQAATQLLEWEIITKHRQYESGDYATIKDSTKSSLPYYTAGYGFTNDDVKKAYNDIINKIAQHGDVTSGAKDTKLESYGNPIILTWNANLRVYEATLNKENIALWDDFGWTEALNDIGISVSKKATGTGKADYTIYTANAFDEVRTTEKCVKQSTNNTKFNGLVVYSNLSVEDGQTIVAGAESIPVSAYMSVRVEKDEAQFRFEKVDSKTNELIGSAGGQNATRYNIFTDAACATIPVATLLIGSTGTTTITLPKADCYYLKEANAPFGYLVSDKVYVAYPNTTTILPDEQIVGSLTIEKTSDDGVIEGWTFEISYEDKNGIQTIKQETNSDGKITLNGLPVYRTDNGAAITYYVTEKLTEEQAKVYKELEIQSATLTSGNANFGITMKFANELLRGSVKVIKTTEDGNVTSVEGIGFTVVGTSFSGAEVSEYGKTDSNGEYIFADLPLGNYTVYEDGNTVPVGYITADSQTIVVVKDTVAELEVLNKTTKTKVSKQDITTGEELPGATLSIIDKESGETIATWVSTQTPHYFEGVLAAGKTYILHEEIAPAGYLLANDVEFTVSEDGTIDEVEMYDDLIRGSITLTKVDEDYPENKLTGAEFTVYNDVDADGKYNTDVDTVYGKLIETEGTYSLTEIPYGHYLVKESKSPADFIADETYYPVFIQENSKTYTVANSSFGFANTEAKGTIAVQKQTEGMVNLEGIKLILEGTSAYGNPVYIEATTDASGIAVFENVPIGVYTITEDGSTVPYGYLTAEPTSVTVEYAEVTEVVIFNTELSGTIAVQKQTEGMVNLEGITLILEGTSDTGRAIRIESTTDANGLATFDAVPVGTYTITEDGSSVPYGYLTAEPTSVTVEYAEMTDVVIFNTEQSGSIVVSKSTVDNNEEAIDDITFILEGTSDTGRYIRREAITNDDGVATFDAVPVGTYTITEDGTTVPMGYLTAEPTSVTVEYAKASNISVVNELMDLGDDRPNDTPQTGEKTPSPIVAVSFAGLLCAAALISRKKSERE